MNLIAAAAVGLTIGFVFSSVSDTFISGAIAGVLTLWINFEIGGVLKS